MGVYQGQNKIFQVQIILFLLFNFADNCNISLMQFCRKLYYFIYSILQTTILFLIIQFCRQLYFFFNYSILQTIILFSIIQFCRQLYYFQFCRQLFFSSQLFNFLDNYIIFNYSIFQILYYFNYPLLQLYQLLHNSIIKFYSLTDNYYFNYI